MPALPRNVAGFSALRARAYVFRLPLFTRLVLAAVVLFAVVGAQAWWDVRAWGALVPREMGFATRRCFVFLVFSLHWSCRFLRGSGC